MLKAIPTLDLSYARAATILASVPDRDLIAIYLVGCGGTGSYMAMHVGRLLYRLTEQGKYVQGFFVDHDRVEPENIGRQLFVEAELGVNKADALALRYGTAWGIGITPVAAKFQSSMLVNAALTIIVGCVDNAEARKTIAKLLGDNADKHAPHTWWLDCGNHEEGGQVLLGTAIEPSQLANAFPSKTICQALPAPSLQSPELLKPRREETKAAKRMSCAELAAANLQSEDINAVVAGQAKDFLTRLLVTRNLKRFACEINLAAGSMRSAYATPEAIATWRTP
jgi:PRTRC genetic system ThiF family protein